MTASPAPLVRLQNAVFHHIGQATAAARPVFRHPIQHFELLPSEKWAIIGSQKTNFLRVLHGQYIAQPPLSRTFPYLLQHNLYPSSAISFLNFNSNGQASSSSDNGGSSGFGLPKVHLSARYEFFKEDLDQTVYKFVTHQLVNVNNDTIDSQMVQKVLDLFQLSELQNNWLMGLSNGQLRRARFAKAVVQQPKLLLVEDPFLGLDPTATAKISGILGHLAPQPYVAIGLRSQDDIPEWVTNVAIVNDDGLVKSGRKSELAKEIEELKQQERQQQSMQQQSAAEVASKVVDVLYGNGNGNGNRSTSPHIEFDNVSIAYRGKQILKDLNFKVQHGEKWHIRGNNGTGKTTLLSLIMADHPQSWNSKIIINGEPRQVGKLNYFDINKAIGFSSPELHAIFPGSLSVYEALTTGFNTGPSNFIPLRKTRLSGHQRQSLELLLEEFGFEDEVWGNKRTLFRDLSISDQKLVLFLRAIVKGPELLILDEGFSCMDAALIAKCKGLLSDSWPSTVLSIGHVADEVPYCNKFIRLVAPGEYEVGEVEVRN